MKHDRLKRAWQFALVLGIALPAAIAGAASFKHENKPQNLKALFEQMHQAVHVKQDVKQATALFQSMMPDQARIKKALKDNVAPETVQQILDMHRKFGVSDETVRKLARAEQKEVQVHGATTEDIIRYRDGSVAYNEFPGGTKRVAEQLLRPGMTYYEVEYLLPGKDAGMKYHLLYWDGKQWTMLGPVWRVLKQ
jgi:hypothetical protein